MFCGSSNSPILVYGYMCYCFNEGTLLISFHDSWVNPKSYLGTKSTTIQKGGASQI